MAGALPPVMWEGKKKGGLQGDRERGWRCTLQGPFSAPMKHTVIFPHDVHGLPPGSVFPSHTMVSSSCAAVRVAAWTMNIPAEDGKTGMSRRVRARSGKGGDIPRHSKKRCGVFSFFFLSLSLPLSLPPSPSLYLIVVLLPDVLVAWGEKKLTKAFLAIPKRVPRNDLDHALLPHPPLVQSLAHGNAVLHRRRPRIVCTLRHKPRLLLLLPPTHPRAGRSEAPRRGGADPAPVPKVSMHCGKNCVRHHVRARKSVARPPVARLRSGEISADATKSESSKIWELGQGSSLTVFSASHGRANQLHHDHCEQPSSSGHPRHPRPSAVCTFTC